jgi:hypothetical protein
MLKDETKKINIFKEQTKKKNIIAMNSRTQKNYPCQPGFFYKTHDSYYKIDITS